MLDILIRNARVFNAHETFTADIEIEKGKIVGLVNSSQKEARKELDASDFIVLPAGIDSHTHMQLKLPNYLSSDTFESGTYAAVMGGITTIIDFAYQEPGENLRKTLENRLKEIKKPHCDVKLHIGITNMYEGIDKDIAYLVENGYNTFKIHMNDPNVDDAFLYKLYSILSKFEKAISVVHCEEGKIIKTNIDNLVKQGKTGVSSHPISRPEFVEEFAVKKIVNYANEFKVKTYIVHLSTARAKRFLAHAKSKYVFVETCPQYLYLTDDMYNRPDGYLYTCSPPFRKPIDNAELIKGISDDTIDTLATDHCPFWKKDKDNWGGDFTKLPYGIPGVETLYSLSLNLSISHSVPINKIVEKIAYNPAKIFGLLPDKGEIAVGANAEIVLFKKQKYSISYKNLHMNCDFSPYENFTLYFKPHLVVNKEKIYEVK